MTATCRVCRCEIAQRFVGAMVVWGHLVNPRDEHHYAKPVREEQRAEPNPTVVLPPVRAVGAHSALPGAPRGVR